MRDDPEKAEAKGKSDINANAQRIQGSITAQSSLPKAADEAIARSRDELKRNVAAREAQIKTVVEDLNAKVCDEVTEGA